ncbi:hypothetical protein [Terrabacter sp. NPDC080008]|uniref:hypothetical protein n=1 Tax=Terrabacter sp. NPDC080008 TaxID=3155176 RepID=UPI00344E193F
MAGYMRRVVRDRPYGVVNDFIASTLGARIGAPVPPIALITDGSSAGSISMGFGEGGRTPPPADASRVAVDDPYLATGIIVLDQWTLNGDRHDENLAYLPRFGLAAFDFDCALIGPKPQTTAVDSLQKGLMMPLPRHILAEHLPTLQWLWGWISKVRAVSAEDIRRCVYLCFDARLITVAERDKLIDFLTLRQRWLGDIMDRGREIFTGIDDWPLLGWGR